MGAAMTEGLLGPGNGGGSSTYLINNSASLIVTAKHGVAYGVSNSDGYAADMSDRNLMEVFMRPWRAFAAKGGRGLMISHPTLNHVPMHANAAILNWTLRNLLGLNQALFGSDYENVKWLSDAFHHASNHSDAAVKALYAGVDQEMQNVAVPATLGASGAGWCVGRVRSGHFSCKRSARQICCWIVRRPHFHRH